MTETNGGPAPAPSPLIRYGRLHTLTLPSGAKVRARRPSTMTLVTSGIFPSELATAVWAMQRDGFAKLNTTTDPGEYKRFAEVVDGFIPHVLVEPKIGEATELTLNADGCLTGFVELSQMPDEDKTHLFFFGQGLFRGDEEMGEEKARMEVLANDLQPFRDGTARPDPGPGGEALQPAAVESGGAAGGVADGA